MKRVLALPGEEVFGTLRRDHLEGPGQGMSCGCANGCEPTRGPPDSYFVLGDNRENSLDSRYSGFVRREKIVGRVIAIYRSWDGDNHRPRLDRIGRRR